MLENERTSISVIERERESVFVFVLYGDRGCL